MSTTTRHINYHNSESLFEIEVEYFNKHDVEFKVVEVSVPFGDNNLSLMGHYKNNKEFEEFIDNECEKYLEKEYDDIHRDLRGDVDLDFSEMGN